MKTENPLLAYFETTRGALIPVRILRMDGTRATVLITGTKTAQGHDTSSQGYRKGDEIQTSWHWLRTRDVRWRMGHAYTIPADCNTARSLLTTDTPQE